MKRVKVKDKEFELSISGAELDSAIQKVADKINKDLEGKNPLFLVVLNGAFMFASDLLKKITIECEISFVKLSSYVGTQTTHTVRELIGLDEDIHDRTIVIIEDLIDTGITMGATIEKLKNMKASEVKIASMLFKPQAFQKDYPIDYIGMDIPSDFIVGYGLDYDGHGRNLPDIYQLVEE
ncbi:MAG: hypoxanthine phosphoribosyltransferase [Bacteroidales bacterium]